MNCVIRYDSHLLSPSRSSCHLGLVRIFSSSSRDLSNALLSQRTSLVVTRYPGSSLASLLMVSLSCFQIFWRVGLGMKKKKPIIDITQIVQV